MGQLERYGLYVLCLVIFLILGVAIWGEDPAAAATRSPLAMDREVTRPTDEGIRRPTNPARDDLPEDPGDLDDVKHPAPGAGGDSVSDPQGPRVQPVPVPTPSARPRTHKVIKDDVLESIARRYYDNDPRAVADILKANPGLRPERLKIGTELILPDRAGTPAAAPVATPTKAVAPTETREGLHIVKPNENLGGISTTYYGTASLADSIARLNGIRDPRSLMIKQELRLPKKPATKKPEPLRN